MGCLAPVANMLDPSRNTSKQREGWRKGDDKLDALGVSTNATARKEFRKRIREWRFSKITSDNRPVAQLTEWSSGKDQKALLALAEMFLAEIDHIERFWSADCEGSERLGLQYPEDRQK